MLPNKKAAVLDANGRNTPTAESRMIVDDMEIFRKLAQCEDKEQMQRCIDEYNLSQKTITNADRIRSMNDEELADFIIEAEACGNEGVSIADWGMTVLEWLKQPADH